MTPAEWFRLTLPRSNASIWQGTNGELYVERKSPGAIENATGRREKASARAVLGGPGTAARGTVSS